MGSTQMLRSTIAAAAVASAAAFSAPAALPGRVSTRAAVAKGPSMQLYRDGEIQGLHLLHPQRRGRPSCEPRRHLGWRRWLRPPRLLQLAEPELGSRGGDQARPCCYACRHRHDRAGPHCHPRLREAVRRRGHDEASRPSVKQGAMQQLLLWLGLLELLSGVPAVIQTLKGSERMPGDFGFDPLGCGKDPNALARRQLVELKNGRLAMIAVGGMVHHYLLVGRGPIEFIKNIPNFKNPLPPF